MMFKKAEISGWGNYPKKPSLLVRPEKLAQLQTFDESTIPRGMGRSYGDAAINENRHVILMERLNRFIHFDPSTGFLRAEAGCTLREILEVFLPKGWFLPVTPGTKYASLGGCIAADVHGKNHHKNGTLSTYIHEIKMVLADGSIKKCSKTDEPELFWATVGGMGLTGIIAEAVIELIPIETAYMSVSHHDAPNLEKALELLTDPSIDDHYSVAWIDCLASKNELGRSVVMTGHHARHEELGTKIQYPFSIEPRIKASIPFNVPSWALNTFNIKLFNSLYYATQKRKGSFISDYDSYFYPLDSIYHWNKIYGTSGFLQYQFVIPEKDADISLKRIVEKFSDSKRCSFLAVLKKLGKQNPGYLSFPFEGFTLALDLPLRDDQLLSFLREIDAIVLEYGGRVYLAKDARLEAEVFRSMYPRYPEWRNIKRLVDPQCKFQSDLSRRLKMGEMA